MVPLLMTLIDL